MSEIRVRKYVNVHDFRHGVRESKQLNEMHAIMCDSLHVWGTSIIFFLIQILLEELNVLTKIHYKAPSDGQWGEHEVDYGVHTEGNDNEPQWQWSSRVYLRQSTTTERHGWTRQDGQYYINPFV